MERRALILAVCSIGVVLLPLAHRSTDARADPNQSPTIDEPNLSLLASEDGRNPGDTPGALSPPYRFYADTTAEPSTLECSPPG
jgi:hypothetical protein